MGESPTRLKKKPVVDPTHNMMMIKNHFLCYNADKGRKRSVKNTGKILMFAMGAMLVQMSAALKRDELEPQALPDKCEEVRMAPPPPSAPEDSWAPRPSGPKPWCTKFPCEGVTCDCHSKTGWAPEDSEVAETSAPLPESKSFLGLTEDQRRALKKQRKEAKKAKKRAKNFERFIEELRDEDEQKEVFELWKKSYAEHPKAHKELDALILYKRVTKLNNYVTQLSEQGDMRSLEQVGQLMIESFGKHPKAHKELDAKIDTHMAEHRTALRRIRERREVSVWRIAERNRLSQLEIPVSGEVVIDQGPVAAK